MAQFRCPPEEELDPLLEACRDHGLGVEICLAQLARKPFYAGSFALGIDSLGEDDSFGGEDDEECDVWLDTTDRDTLCRALMVRPTTSDAWNFPSSSVVPALFPRWDQCYVSLWNEIHGAPRRLQRNCDDMSQSGLDYIGILVRFLDYFFESARTRWNGEGGVDDMRRGRGMRWRNLRDVTDLMGISGHHHMQGGIKLVGRIYVFIFSPLVMLNSVCAMALANAAKLGRAAGKVVVLGLRLGRRARGSLLRHRRS